MLSIVQWVAIPALAFGFRLKFGWHIAGALIMAAPTVIAAPIVYKSTIAYREHYEAMQLVLPIVKADDPARFKEDLQKALASKKFTYITPDAFSRKRTAAGNQVVLAYDVVMPMGDNIAVALEFNDVIGAKGSSTGGSSE